MVCLQIAVDQPLIEQNHLLVTGARRINAIYQPTRVCPEWAPEGKHLVIACALPISSSAPLDAGKEISMCLEDLRGLCPGFKKHSEILLAGTYRDEWPGMHARPGHDMPRKTPIINLYNVGDGVKSSGYTGLPAVVHSGVMVAEEIRQRVNLLKITTVDASAKIHRDGLQPSFADYG